MKEVVGDPSKNYEADDTIQGRDTTAVYNCTIDRRPFRYKFDYNGCKVRVGAEC